MMPDSFIHLAEQTGLIVTLGRQVLQAACSQVGEWRREVPAGSVPMLIVNLSAKQLEDEGLIDIATMALREAELEPGSLAVEITESVIVESEATITLLERMRGLGLRIGIDDFGTGYSSLTYLHRLPIDILKIDQRFIAALPDDPRQAALVESIIAMSHSLGIIAIAEGVETAEQAAVLARLGCDLAQGYYFARPSSAIRTAALLRTGLGLPQPAPRA